MTQKMTVTPYVDLTSRMVGNTAAWPWEINIVYVNGVSVWFIWSDGVLTLPDGYTSGVVLADFTLYLLYDAPSSYMPRDPTDPSSTPVFWENRLSQFFSVSSSIKSFEQGLTEVSGGSIGIRIDDEWLDLITELVIFSNRTIRIYTDDVISYKGVTTKMDIADYVMTVQIQKRQTIMDSELHWGDPEYLNRVDRSVNNAYYNGANIPTEFQGQAIPFFFGDQFPYEAKDGEEEDLGNAIPNFFVPPGNKRAGKGVNTSTFIARVIPTGASTGIIGRMPSWQSISSVPINQALTGSQHQWTKAEQGNNTVIMTKMILGEVCTLSSPSAINCARLYNRDTNRGYFVMSADDPSATDDMADPANFVAYTGISGCDENLHFFPSAIPKTTWTGGAVLSGTFTPGGHRWLTLTSIGGMDLRTDDLYVVITAITGEKTAVEVMQFALECHGYTVDAASFTALAAEFPYKTVQQAGFGANVPTLGAFIAEINRSLLTILVFPASNDEPFLVKVNPNQTPSQTLYEEQISGLRFGHEYREQCKAVEFRPKYARSEAQQASLYRRYSASMATLFGSERSLSIDHVLADVPPERWEEMTEFFGSPNSTVTFNLTDDEVELELADCVQLDHPACCKKIFVTQITKQPLGRQIQGRYFYVNNNS
jgi:hypothetical protein